MEQSAISEPETRSESVKERSDPSIIDRSVRIPVLIFLASGVFWLIVASGFWLLASSQIHTPAAWWTFPGVAWLSFGRAYPLFSTVSSTGGLHALYRCRHLAAGAALPGAVAQPIVSDSRGCHLEYRG